jgi:hypothetical protein
VPITHYKTLFSEYNRGPTSFIYRLSKITVATLNPAINQNDSDNLKESLVKPVKKISKKKFFYRGHNADKDMQLNHLAYHSKQPVCFIDCQQLVDKYIEEFQKTCQK